MFCANRPFIEDILFVSLELLQSCVEREDFPVATFFDKSDQTLTSAVDRIEGKEELHANDFAFGINGRELWCSDYVGCIHSDILESKSVS